jgi:antirestriction protein ArdC
MDATMRRSALSTPPEPTSGTAAARRCSFPCGTSSHCPTAVPSRTNEEAHDATTLHELGHWSGHKSRLNRDLAGRFGTRSYAAEELIAELTSAFLCAHLGITGELRHAGYIGDWLSLLREDDRAIFTAASKASQADEYLRSFSETLPDEER